LSIERSIELQNFICEALDKCKVRNRSGEDLVEAQMFIRLNAHLMRSSVVPTIPVRSHPVEMLPTDPEGTAAAPIHLQYLLPDVPAVVLPADSEAAAVIPMELDEPAPVINDVEEDEAEVEVDEAAAPAGPVVEAEPIATAEQEDEFMLQFIKANNIKPNKANRVNILGDLDNELSKLVRLHKPTIKSSMCILKSRLSALAKSL
jgi:hypothetical protein